MEKERLVARGRYEELKREKFSLIVEIRTLAEDIRRKIPTPELDSEEISMVKVDEARVLLQRLGTLEKEFSEVTETIKKIRTQYDFDD